MIKTAVAAAFLAFNFYIYHYLATNERLPPRESLESFPISLDTWACDERIEIEPKVLRNLGVTDYLVCDFASQDHGYPVSVYVGYHATQVRKEGGGAGENSIHPPRHCLPGAGWNIMKADIVRLDLPGMPGGGGEVNRLMIAKGEARQLVYFWYNSRGRVIAEDWKKIVALFWDRARFQRTDGSLIRFTTPVMRGEDEAAEQAILDLASQMMPRLSRFVPE